MKIVHSWLQMDSNHHQDKFFYQMTLLSILAAKKSFGNIHLYTNEEGKNHFEKFNFPYDSISTELEGMDVERGGFAMGKLKTYTLQKEPFIHIDHDTFLFEGRHLPPSYRFYFGFPDLQQPFEMKSWLAINETYFQTYQEFSDLFEKEFYWKTNFDVIPNASIFGGTDTETISQVYNVLLELYFNNKERFNSNKFSSCLLEQFLFFPIAELLNEDVVCNNRWINDNSYIWSQDVPLTMYHGDVRIHGKHIFKIPRETKNIMGYETKNYDPKVRVLIDNWFGGFLHLAHLRDDVTIRWVMLEKLKKYYDAEKYLNRIDEIFPKKYAWEKNIFSSLL
tara:strand:- start:318 stop:1322 length:1005 start_codon:yes stop_codon:yes gene_type:complete